MCYMKEDRQAGQLEAELAERPDPDRSGNFCRGLPGFYRALRQAEQPRARRPGKPRRPRPTVSAGYPPPRVVGNGRQAVEAVGESDRPVRKARGRARRDVRRCTSAALAACPSSCAPACSARGRIDEAEAAYRRARWPLDEVGRRSSGMVATIGRRPSTQNAFWAGLCVRDGPSMARPTESLREGAGVGEAEARRERCSHVLRAPGDGLRFTGSRRRIAFGMWRKVCEARGQPGEVGTRSEGRRQRYLPSLGRRLPGRSRVPQFPGPYLHRAGLVIYCAKHAAGREGGSRSSASTANLREAGPGAPGRVGVCLPLGPLLSQPGRGCSQLAARSDAVHGRTTRRRSRSWSNSSPGATDRSGPNVLDVAVLRATMLAGRGEHAERPMMRTPWPGGGYRSNSPLQHCLLFAVSSAAAQNDGKLAAADRTRLKAHICRPCPGVPGYAVAEGFQDISLLKDDPDLASLRSREDLHKLVREVERKRGSSDRSSGSSKNQFHMFHANLSRSNDQAQQPGPLEKAMAHEKRYMRPRSAAAPGSASVRARRGSPIHRGTRALYRR